MSNSVTKQLEVLFGEYVEGFDASCVLSNAVKQYRASDLGMQRAGDVYYRPQDYQMATQSGLDISGGTPTDVIQRQVPCSFRSPENVRFDLDAKEMRDPEHLKESGKAAGLSLAAKIDSDMYSTIALRAANVIRTTSAFSWDLGASAEAMMLKKGMKLGSERHLVMNATDYVAVAKDLGNRQYTTTAVMDAYERSKVPDIAGFRTYRSDNLYNLAAIGTVTSTTVNANTSHTVTAMTSDLPTDNRVGTLVVAGANIANIKNGDAFTIGSAATAVNSVHHITKTDTGELQTFRVISGAGTANLVISPAIIITGPYQNVTQQAAAGATINFLNTVTKPVNPFWVHGAVELGVGKLAFPADMGPKVMTANSKNGVPLIMSYDFDHLTGKASCRFTTLYATTVLEPELCGIILANQT